MHLYDGEKLLRTLENFLKKGGAIFITESNDRISTLAPDEKNLLGQFLDILKEDKYAGKRETGQTIAALIGNGILQMHRVGKSICRTVCKTARSKRLPKSAQQVSTKTVFPMPNGYLR